MIGSEHFLPLGSTPKVRPMPGELMKGEQPPLKKLKYTFPWEIPAESLFIQTGYT